MTGGWRLREGVRLAPALAPAPAPTPPLRTLRTPSSPLPSAERGDVRQRLKPVAPGPSPARHRVRGAGGGGSGCCCASRATSPRGLPALQQLPRLLSGGGAHLAPSCHRRRVGPSPPTASPPQRWSGTPGRCRYRPRPGEGKARPEGAAGEDGWALAREEGPGRAGDLPPRGEGADGGRRRRRAGKFPREWRSCQARPCRRCVPRERCACRTPNAGGCPWAVGHVPCLR